MLTATYAIVTLAVEQKKARGVLTTLQQQIRTRAAKPELHDRASFESILYQLVQFDESCHWRNIELYVIPALRNATAEADELIAELETFSAEGETILREVRAGLARDFQTGVEGVNAFCAQMDNYCHHLLRRISKEEHELLPIVQRVITGEDWFDLAAQFISHDAEIHAHKLIMPTGRNPFAMIRQQAATV